MSAGAEERAEPTIPLPGQLREAGAAEPPTAYEPCPLPSGAKPVITNPHHPPPFAPEIALEGHFVLIEHQVGDTGREWVLVLNGLKPENRKVVLVFAGNPTCLGWGQVRTRQSSPGMAIPLGGRG